MIKGDAACIAGATGTTARTRACSTSTATTPVPTPTRTSASAPLLPCQLISCELRLCRSTKAKGTHFPADKAKDKRSRSLPVKDTGGDGQTAQAGRSCSMRVKSGRRKTAASRSVTRGPFYKNMEGVTAIKRTEKPSLLERIYSWENLLNAYHEAASEKWYRGDVLAFSAKLEENLIEIQNSLIWRTYKVGRYREFYVSEPKRRLIMALNFLDRVVQWAVYLQVNKELDNGMIYHSYGCRVGKGSRPAAILGDAR